MLLEGTENMSETNIERVISLMTQRLLTIKKDNICSVNNRRFDCSIDEIVWTEEDFKKRDPKRCCRLFAEYRTVDIREEFGRYRIESYNVIVNVDYNRERNLPESDYEIHKDRLALWMYLVLSDSSTQVNNFWQEVYHKTSKMRFRWVLLKKASPKSFRGQLMIPNLTIRTSVDDIFV